MAGRIKERIEFGDFQTPVELARGVCQLLRRAGVRPASIIEPTCGTGTFLRTAIEVFPDGSKALGVERNSEYADTARAGVSAGHVEVHNEDFFEKDWAGTLDALPEPILLIGNPPWVTSSTVGALKGSNLPSKTNFQQHRGLDALTGKSNFDISEWMILHLLEILSGRSGTLAMLCKTVVARKVLRQAWNNQLQVRESTVYLIDAAQHFGAAVDACLLVCTVEEGAASAKCDVFPTLDAREPSSTFALREDCLVADLDRYEAFGHLAGKSPLRWRSGIKHDCARIMELRRVDGGYRNGLGETVQLEETYLFPMLKSSEVARPEPTPTRWMLVPQRTIGEDTATIEQAAPLTWAYLSAHAERLEARASSIYRKRPRFSIFGVGPYSFAPFKVAISGFYKTLEFRCVGPVEGKPVVLDDTCYFLPCRSREDAETVAALLRSPPAQGLFRAFIFWDAKRPITAQLLSRLDLGKLATEIGVKVPSLADPPG
jgi:hypothetical protein